MRARRRELFADDKKYEITEGVSSLPVQQNSSDRRKTCLQIHPEQFVFILGNFIYQLTRLFKDEVAYLDVHIAVRIESAVDHMQRDIDVRYRVQEGYDKRLLHLHDVGFFTLLFFPYFLIFFLLSLMLRRYAREEKNTFVVLGGGEREKNAFTIQISENSFA
jgi:hypothetical protein